MLAIKRRTKQQRQTMSHAMNGPCQAWPRPLQRKKSDLKKNRSSRKHASAHPKTQAMSVVTARTTMQPVPMEMDLDVLAPPTICPESIRRPEPLAMVRWEEKVTEELYQQSQLEGSQDLLHCLTLEHLDCSSGRSRSLLLVRNQRPSHPSSMAFLFPSTLGRGLVALFAVILVLIGLAAASSSQVRPKPPMGDGVKVSSERR
jgi:hypothetical protein